MKILLIIAVVLALAYLGFLLDFLNSSRYMRERKNKRALNNMADWIVNCDLDVCQICANYKLGEGENSPEDYPDDIEPCPFLRKQGKTACRNGIIEHFSADE